MVGQERYFVVECIGTIQEQMKNAAQKVLGKVRSALRKAEVSRANKEQMKEREKGSIEDGLEKGKIEANRANRKRAKRRDGIKPVVKKNYRSLWK